MRVKITRRFERAIRSVGSRHGEPVEVVFVQKEKRIVKIDVSTTLAEAVDAFPQLAVSSSAGGWTIAAVASARSATHVR